MLTDGDRILPMIRHLSPLLPTAPAMFAAATSAAEIRDYQPQRHDRFADFPSEPAWNDDAWIEGKAYAGVGWWQDDPRYQYAMVTPQHFVCATHARPPGGSTIRFLHPDGQLIERQTTSYAMVRNEDGQPTDLTVVTLSAPLPSEFGFFPYLNLPTESAYLGLELTVFGFHAKTGRGIFHDLHDGTIAGLGETRLFEFRYQISSGGGDDVFLQAGDSGSPSFAMAGGRPALIGIHGAIGEADDFRLNYDTFVPHYVDEVNALLDPHGYRLTAAHPAALELDVKAVARPTRPRQGQAASLEVQAKNLSSHDAANVRISLEFPAGTSPTSMAGDGWIRLSDPGNAWAFRRGGIDAHSSMSLIASWNRLPAVESLPIVVTHASDGSSPQVFHYQLKPAPSYAAWSENLAEPDPEADPDGDGLVNLLEYGFGSDPAAAESTATPEFSVQGPMARLQFPVREDAELRGISYLLEFSKTLETADWRSEPPPGLIVSELPGTSGLRLRTVFFDALELRHFVRVRVVLDEGDN
jgi:hypothetical protein